MDKKNKGRQKIEMVKMDNESNLQVTFSKRRAGLFKKASELCTLCGADVAIIVFSPGRKVFSFGHPTVDSIIDRFINSNPPLDPNQQNQLQLTSAHRNTVIQELNNHLTMVSERWEFEKRKSEKIKKIRSDTKKLGNWMEDAVEGMNMDQVHEFKAHLENLKKKIQLKAAKIYEAHVADQQNFQARAYSNAGGGDEMDGGGGGGGGGGNDNISPDVNMFGQSGMIHNNMDHFNYNQNTNLPNFPIPFGNNEYGDAAADQGLVPDYQFQNQNQIQNQNPSFLNQFQNQNMDFPNQSQNPSFLNQIQNQNMGFPNQNQTLSFPNQNMGFPNQNPSFQNQDQTHTFNEENTYKYGPRLQHLLQYGVGPFGTGSSGAGSSGAGSYGAGFSAAKPSGPGLSGIGFSGAGDSGAGFTGVGPYGAGFSGVVPSGAGFSGAEFSGDGFAGAGPSGAGPSGSGFFGVGPFGVGPYETEFSGIGLSAVGPSEVGLSEAGPSEDELVETDSSEDEPSGTGPSEIGPSGYY